MNWKVLKSFPEGERIVAMVQYKDMVVVATSNRVFKFRDNEDAVQVVFREVENMDDA